MRKSSSSSSSSSSDSPEPKRHKTEREGRITQLQNTITENNKALLRSFNEISEFSIKLLDLVDAKPSDRIEEKKTLLNKALAAAEKSEKSLTNEIAKLEAELKQLQGAEPIPLPTPGKI